MPPRPFDSPSLDASRLNDPTADCVLESSDVLSFEIGLGARSPLPPRHFHPVFATYFSAQTLSRVNIFRIYLRPFAFGDLALVFVVVFNAIIEFCSLCNLFELREGLPPNALWQ